MLVNIAMDVDSPCPPAEMIFLPDEHDTITSLRDPLAGRQACTARAQNRDNALHSCAHIVFENALTVEIILSTSPDDRFGCKGRFRPSSFNRSHAGNREDDL